MTVSEYVKSWIREHQQTLNRSAVEEKQTKVSGEEGIREDQPYSINAMSVICSQTTVSGEGGIREDRAHTAKGKQTTVRVNEFYHEFGLFGHPDKPDGRILL
jgi:hypothetical protein